MTKQIRNIFKGIFLLLLIVGTIFIIKNNNNLQPYQKDTGAIFGTYYHITYQNSKDIQQGIETKLHEVDQSLSTFNKTSTLSLINQNKSNKTDKMLVEVFTLAQKISANTNGAFDITVAPFVNIWGFGFKNKENVTKQIIDSIRQYVGYKKISIKRGVIQKQDSRTMIDMSAIAKGYGCDMVAQYLERNNIKNYMIEIGGEIRAKGKNKEGNIWRIGISNPKDDPTNLNQDITAILQLTNTGLATSGNYRNFYYKNGKKFAHTIDPHTGFPVQHSILSSSVLAPTCAEADAYATAFMVLGVEQSQKVLEKQPQLKAYFIYADKNGKYKTWYSKGLKKDILQ